MSFRCDFCGKSSEPRTLEKQVITEWRLKTYPAKELPPIIGSNVKRWSQAGEGFEAAVTKKSCSACDVKNAPVPRAVNTNPVAVHA